MSPRRSDVPVTMRDIATYCGVSQPVVSKSLFGGSTSVRVSAATKQAVLDAAQKLGYRPNGAARSMSRQRFGRVTLLQFRERHYSYLPQALVESLVQTLEKHDLTMALQRCSAEELNDDHYVPAILRESDSDGLLVNVNHHLGLSLRALLDHHHVPAIWLNIDDPTDSVFSDDRLAAHTLTTHLLSLGYNRICYVGVGLNPNTDHYSRRDRLRGFHDAMTAAGLPAESILVPNPAVVRMTDQVDQLLASAAPPQVWLTYSTHEVEMLQAHFLNQGIRLGKGAEVATFVDRNDSASLSVARMIQPLAAVGIAGVELLLEKIAAPSVALPSRIIPWTLFPSARNSTGNSSTR